MPVGSYRVWQVLIQSVSRLCLSHTQESMAELDEIPRLEGRFQALITYIMFKKILARAPTILYRLEFITVSESVGKRCKPSLGGTYVSLAWIFMEWGGSSLRSDVLSCAHYFQAPATQARRKPCLCRYFAFVVALVFVAFADMPTLTIQLWVLLTFWVFLTFLTASWQHSQSHGFLGKIILKWNEMLPYRIKWKIQWGILVLMFEPCWDLSINSLAMTSWLYFRKKRRTSCYTCKFRLFLKDDQLNLESLKKAASCYNQNQK